MCAVGEDMFKISALSLRIRFDCFPLSSCQVSSRMFHFVILVSLFWLSRVGGFSVQIPVAGRQPTPKDDLRPSTRVSPLLMGRAAAVRAATKSKTDARKAKTNAVFGKRIIMAVKQVCRRTNHIRQDYTKYWPGKGSHQKYAHLKGRFRRSECQPYAGGCDQGGKGQQRSRGCKYYSIIWGIQFPMEDFFLTLKLFNLNPEYQPRYQTCHGRKCGGLYWIYFWGIRFWWSQLCH